MTSLPIAASVAAADLFEDFSDGTIRAVRFSPWAKAGIVHGFIGASHSGRLREGAELSSLKALSGAEELVTVEQVHGALVLHDNLSAGSAGAPVRVLGAADGIVSAVRGRKRALVIKTADCLPILMVAGGVRAVVHAGWRGLSAGIVEYALKEIALLTKEVPTVVIGPAAGPEEYEVGPEVLDAFKGNCAFAERPGRNPVLNLAGTCAHRVAEACPGAICAVYPVCTIKSREWHSHRRDGAGAGRNLAFLCLSPE